MLSTQYELLIDSNCETILRLALNIASRLVELGVQNDVVSEELDMLITINGDTKRLARISSIRKSFEEE